MIEISSAQLDAWIAAYAYPLSRVLGLVATAPVFNNAALTVTTRLIAGLAITIAIVPVLPQVPVIPPGSWLGLMVLAQQMLIGVVMGFTLRIAFTAVDLAGQLIGLQMGLSFAVFYDPQNSAQTPVVAELLGLLALLIYIATNGHLMSLAALAESFTLLPISTAPFAAKGLSAVLAWSAALFSTGLLLALPLVAALLIANLALGVLSRIAPQLNLFAVGFPVTIVSGFVVLTLSLPLFSSALQRLFDDSFAVLRRVIAAGVG